MLFSLSIEFIKFKSHLYYRLAGLLSRSRWIPLDLPIRSGKGLTRICQSKPSGRGNGSDLPIRAERKKHAEQTLTLNP